MPIMGKLIIKKMPSEFETFLTYLSSQPIKIIDMSINFEDYVSFDLSVNNSKFNKEIAETSSVFQKYVHGYLKENNAKVAYGGYNEERHIYKRASHFNDIKVEERNIHLGLDLWLHADSRVYTPLNGTVYGYADNVGLGNYGPTIILKHDINSIVFYTLYGHLSRASLKDLYIGKPFKVGDIIATLGRAEVNGDYPPHLHFQIIKNIANWQSDYPGVCGKSERDMYLFNCPNPNLLLKIGL